MVTILQLELYLGGIFTSSFFLPSQSSLTSECFCNQPSLSKQGYNAFIGYTTSTIKHDDETIEIAVSQN